MPGGKPPRFKSPDELEVQAEEYFAQCEEIGRPPLISGLCLHLGIHTETLRDYGTKPEYSAIVKQLKLRVQLALEYLTFDGAAKTGAIFNLKCNHQFRDSDQINITLAGDAANPVNINYRNLSTEQLDVYKQAAANLAKLTTAADPLTTIPNTED